MKHAHDKPRQLRDAVRHLIVANGTLESTRRPCGKALAVPHAYALLELHRAGTAMTVSELASKLAIDRTNVSRLCAKMEAGGELERGTHAKDSRARALALTAHGKQVAEKVDRGSARHFSRLAEQLDGETLEVIRALNRLAEVMADVMALDHGQETESD